MLKICVYWIATLALTSTCLAQLPAPLQTPFGLNYVPAHIPESTPEDSAQALVEALSIGGHVSYIWEWSSGNKGYEDAAQLTAAARSIGLKVFLQLSPTAIGAAAAPEEFPQASFQDPNVRARYLSDVELMAGLQPEYLILAAEINLLYAVNPAEFAAFQTLYAEAYRRMKIISPTTQVGVSFHMDMLFSLNQLKLLEIMGPQDFVALTSYPAWLISSGIYKTVADIPLWYYRRLRLIIARPIIFSELAWPSGGKSNLEMQEAFVARLPELLRGVNPTLVTWAMQHDVRHFQVQWLNEAQIRTLLGFKVDPAELFDELNTMGLLSWDGPPKPAWFRAVEYAESGKPR
jgi:hypothetical protein